MTDTEKILLLAVGGIGLYYVVRGVSGAAEASPITPTKLERQVMKHKDLIWRKAIKYDVDPGLIAAIMANESSGRPQGCRLIVVKAYGGEEKMDWVCGLMQVRLDTAKFACDIWHQSDLQDDEANVDCGVKYLRDMLNRFGQIDSAVSAYNAGPGNVLLDTSMVGGMEWVNAPYIRAVLEMIPRFRVLFMSYKGADVYMSSFPGRKWRFEMPEETILPAVIDFELP